VARAHVAAADVDRVALDRLAVERAAGEGPVAQVAGLEVGVERLAVIADGQHARLPRLGVVVEVRGGALGSAGNWVRNESDGKGDSVTGRRIRELSAQMRWSREVRLSEKSSPRGMTVQGGARCGVRSDSPEGVVRATVVRIEERFYGRGKKSKLEFRIFTGAISPRITRIAAGRRLQDRRAIVAIAWLRSRCGRGIPSPRPAANRLQGGDAQLHAVQAAAHLVAAKRIDSSGYSPWGGSFLLLRVQSRSVRVSRTTPQRPKYFGIMTNKCDAGTREVKKGVLRADPPGGADIVLGRPIPQQDDLIAHPIARSQLHNADCIPTSRISRRTPFTVHGPGRTALE
jgi:hypothetical protein